MWPRDRWNCLAPVIVREAMRSMVAHDLGEEEGGKRDIDDDSLIDRFSQHFPNEFKEQQMIVLEGEGTNDWYKVLVGGSVSKTHDLFRHHLQVRCGGRV